MANTAAITVSSATCTAEQTVVATCTVTNGGTGSLNVLSMVPLCTPTGTKLQSTSVALGAPPLGPGMTVAVAGSSGTLALSFAVTPHAPASGYGLAEPASYVYDLGATVYMSDGSIVAASTTTLTVASPSH